MQISTQIGLWFGIAGALLLFVGHLGDTQQYKISRFFESFFWQDRPKTTIRNIVSFSAAGFSTIFLLATFNLAMALWVVLVLSQVVDVWFAIAASLLIPIGIGALVWRSVRVIPHSARSALVRSRLKKASVLIWVGPWVLMFALPSVIIGYLFFTALSPLRRPYRRLKQRLGVAHMTPLLGIALIVIGFALQLKGAISG